MSQETKPRGAEVDHLPAWALWLMMAVLIAVMISTVYWEQILMFVSHLTG